MTTSPPGTTRPRTLTEALRRLDPDALTRLLTYRPDLLSPPPRDVAELAGRTTATASTARAVDQLNAWQRLIAEGLAALPDPSSWTDLQELIGASAGDVRGAVEELRERALLWGADDQLHLVRPVRELFEPYPLGLAPPSARPLSPAEIETGRAACSPEARDVLEKLSWAPAGAVRHADRVVTASSARTPVEQLLAHRLLRPVDAETVLLPREVAWHLRGGRPTPTPVAIRAPELAPTARSAELVDRAAAGAAYELVHDIEVVGYHLETTAHRLLRTGGLGTRDVTVLARLLGTDAAYASFVVECAGAAGLIGPAANLTVLPTPDFDRWAASPSPDRWRAIVRAWSGAPRFFSRSAEPGGHPLGPDAVASVAPGLRSVILRLVTGHDVGAVLDPEWLTEAAAWHRPRLTQGPLDAATVVAWTWREATWLGLVALDAVSSFAYAADRPDDALPESLASLFPAPVEQLLVQSDLTAVSPGPLTFEVAADLRKLADQESRGGGGVFRFSAHSVRRAFDAGWSAAEIHAWLERHSLTPIPQPLTYLVDDVARRHGSIRVGTAASYVRVDDPAQADAALAHPGGRALGLRRVAPGLLVADGDAAEVAALLQQLGHSPAIEDAGGSLVATPTVARAPRRPPTVPESVDPERVARELLANDRLRPGRTESETSTDETLASLRSATSSAIPVRVAYVQADGSSVERDFAPLDVTAGAFRAVSAQDAEIVTIPLARISSVIPGIGAV